MAVMVMNSRKAMRNLVRWRHRREWGTYKCKAECPCRTVVATEKEEVEA